MLAKINRFTHFADDTSIYLSNPDMKNITDPNQTFDVHFAEKLRNC